jgi:hypothetical protein
MERYQVPQFIEEDPKISRFFSMGQLIFIVIGALIILFLNFLIANRIVFALVSILIGSLFMAMAFLRIGGLPFYRIFPNIIKQFWHPKNYIYKSK